MKHLLSKILIYKYEAGAILALTVLIGGAFVYSKTAAPDLSSPAHPQPEAVPAADGSSHAAGQSPADASDSKSAKSSSANSSDKSSAKSSAKSSVKSCAKSPAKSSAKSSKKASGNAKTNETGIVSDYVDVSPSADGAMTDGQNASKKNDRSGLIELPFVPAE